MSNSNQPQVEVLSGPPAELQVYNALEPKEQDELTKKLQSWSTSELEKIQEATQRTEEFYTVRIHEKQFEEAFLPLFTGEPAKYTGVNIDNYAAYIGGVFRPVNIVNDAGHVVVSMPRLCSRTKVNLNAGGHPKDSFYEIIGRVNDIARMIPPQGARMMYQMGKDKWDKIRSHEGIVEYIRDINRVFVYFSREPIRIDGIPDDELGIPAGYRPRVTFNEKGERVDQVRKNTTTPSNSSNSTNFEDHDGFDVETDEW